MDVLPPAPPHPPLATAAPPPPSAGGRPPRGSGRRGGAQGGGGGNRSTGGPARQAPAQGQQQPRQQQQQGNRGGPSAGNNAGAGPGAGGRRRANFGGLLSSDAPASSSTTMTAGSDAGSAPGGNAANGGGGGPSKRSRNRSNKASASASGSTTPSTNGPSAATTGAPAGKRVARPPAPADDAPLAARLTHALSHAPYADCSICFGAIHPAQPTWSCTPSDARGTGPGVRDGEVVDGAGATNCWGVFHLKCIKEWAEGSIRGGEEGGWRCPGCQTKRLLAPKQYLCFCQSTMSPSPPRLSTPHSCASPCSRPRGACAHPCPLDCHPGPCPPCRVEQTLACGSHGTPKLVRCGAPGGGSCGAVCGRPRACGREGHACEETCHEGDCLPCPEEDILTCFCGSHSRTGACNERAEFAVACAVADGAEPTPLGGTAWVGRYSCGEPCPSSFACGIHPCTSSCHAHSHDPAPPCPNAPENVTRCPCGSAVLARLPGARSRTSCTDPVQTCGAVCGRPRECGHACADPCHEGPCGPCAEQVVIPCRCGESKSRTVCSQRQADEREGRGEILCESRCHGLRSCRKHECGRVCCPLAYKAKAKGKRRALETGLADGDGGADDEGEWHTCHIVCGKALACGNHACPALDHKGPCPPCLEASYDELECHCGRTVVLPPIACGRTFNCAYPCVRPPPACGHPKVAHACHEDERCPPCVFLTERECACGKHVVKNTRCSQTKVSCGVACGELLACGWHRCEKTCHAPGECEKCAKPCGKPRRYCGHPCAQPCHSPAACDLSLACAALVTQRCACGRREQQAVCSASSGSPASKAAAVLKCSDDCHKAARNERLAAALGISPDRADRGTAVEWSAELQALGLGLGSSFVGLVEKSLADFIAGPRANQILPHMPLARREFVIKLAEAYRVDTSLVDQEPSRSVQLRRRVDSRVPSPLLSAAISAGQQPVSRSRLNTSRPAAAAAAATAAGGPSAPPAWGAGPPAARQTLAAPVPKPWGNVPTPRASTAASPAGSRAGSPYVAPGRRAGDGVPPPAPGPAAAAAAPVATAAVLSAPAPAQPKTVAPPPSSALADVVPSAAPVVAAADVDDTWEQSDDEA